MQRRREKSKDRATPLCVLNRWRKLQRRLLNRRPEGKIPDPVLPLKHRFCLCYWAREPGHAHGGGKSTASAPPRRVPSQRMRSTSRAVPLGGHAPAGGSHKCSRANAARFLCSREAVTRFSRCPYCYLGFLLLFALYRIRTCGLQLRRLLLYPAELRMLIKFIIIDLVLHCICVNQAASPSFAARSVIRPQAPFGPGVPAVHPRAEGCETGWHQRFCAAAALGRSPTVPTRNVSETEQRGERSEPCFRPAKGPWVKYFRPTTRAMLAVRSTAQSAQSGKASKPGRESFFGRALS